MCTAVAFCGCFGRNLDLEFGYGENVVVMPRRYPMRYRMLTPPQESYALVGMAHISHDRPLYYDAVNEKGLAAAGLRFPGAVYPEPEHGMDNIAPFELIPWVLRQCTDTAHIVFRFCRQTNHKVEL